MNKGFKKETIQLLITSKNLALVYPLLTGLAAALKSKNPYIQLSVIQLAIHLNATYDIGWKQSLEDYITTFLKRWFADHPDTDKPAQTTAEIATTAADKAPIPPATSRILKLSAQGDDRSLVSHGQARNYWYSVADVCVLTTVLRAKELDYVDDRKTEYKKPGGEAASVYRQNRQRVLIADAYVDVGDCQFTQYLTEDIAVITGTHPIALRCHRWTQMPQRLFFPLWRHHHWQLVVLEIDYDRQQSRILWDDPFGHDHFDELFYQTRLPAIQGAVDTLLKTQRLLSSPLAHADKEAKDSKTAAKPQLLIKAVDQQGHGSNGYDCGPIILQNLQDHLRQNASLDYWAKDNHTIPKTGGKRWEEIVQSVRNRHIREAKAASTPSTTERLTTQQTALVQAQQAQKAQCLSGADTDMPEDLALKISQLSATQLEQLFAAIDHQRLIAKKPLDKPYSAEELTASCVSITVADKSAVATTSPAELASTETLEVKAAASTQTKSPSIPSLLFTVPKSTESPATAVASTTVVPTALGQHS